MAAVEWKNRIVGAGTEDPEQLLANPRNWRIHPKHQQDALKALLQEVGWVQNVIVNQRTAHVVDGHLRVSLALRDNEKEVPVVYIDVSEEEEALILSTIDPLSALAATDSEKLDELIKDIGDNPILQQVFNRPDNPEEHWKDMPEFHQNDLTAWKSLTVNFAGKSDLEDFSRLINQTLTEKTRSIWHPPAEIGRYADKQYQDES